MLAHSLRSSGSLCVRSSVCRPRRRRRRRSLLWLLHSLVRSLRRARPRLRGAQTLADRASVPRGARLEQMNERRRRLGIGPQTDRRTDRRCSHKRKLLIDTIAWRWSWANERTNERTTMPSIRALVYVCRSGKRRRRLVRLDIIFIIIRTFSCRCCLRRNNDSSSRGIRGSR